MEEYSIRDILGRNIKFYRNRHGWSQTDLAERAHISTNYMCDIETSKKWPFPDRLSNIARALNVEVYELFRPGSPAPSADADVLKQYNEDVTTLIKKNMRSLEKSLAELLLKHTSFKQSCR